MSIDDDSEEGVRNDAWAINLFFFCAFILSMLGFWKLFEIGVWIFLRIS